MPISSSTLKPITTTVNTELSDTLNVSTNHTGDTTQSEKHQISKSALVPSELDCYYNHQEINQVKACVR